MSRRSSIVIALVFLAGCSQATLPYKPEAQPKGAKVAAAYQMLADRLKIGIGIGGASIGRGGGIGTGVGVGVPVGEGPSRIEGHTFATFPLDQVGPPPWRLHLKLDGVAPTTILIGGAPTQ
ncbi:MAG: hypothetical protein DME13_20840 [Candidatus Rokuibacteriota bacterium]|nr:MAG: hypothetical protein DME13_20840 [Candidatus Rokubacteria bacterium]